MSWDWIHLLRPSICFPHQDTSLQPGDGLFFYFLSSFKKKKKSAAVERRLVPSALAPDTRSGLIRLVSYNCASVRG